MSKIKPIRTEQDYEEALVLLGALVAEDPDPESEAGDQLSILSTLVENYESKHFPKTLPSSIEAIKFRMEQEDLKPADLVPFLGSRSRVSEVLSGKRSLSIDMIRALEQGLGIPAKVLLQKTPQSEELLFKNWDTKLLGEMTKRHYFGGVSVVKDVENTLRDFFSNLTSPLKVEALLRQASYRSAPTTDNYALIAWSARVLNEAKALNLTTKYKPGTIDLGFMDQLAKLSVKEDSPLQAQKALAKVGIALIIEPPLPRTRLDGAALMMDGDSPVIGLTLRLDRLDNFWFTLMHELAHVALHYDNREIDLFYDELDAVKGMQLSDKEKDADRLASEALVPEAKWTISPARLIPSPMAAKSLAKEQGVDVSIIAGKIRYESGKWSYLNSLVAEKTVRQFFTDKDWN